MTKGLPFVGGVAEVLVVSMVVEGIVLVRAGNPRVSQKKTNEQRLASHSLNP